MSGVARHWIAVASAEHVALGRAGGFMQVCHGKAAPLRRIAPGDGVIYYSSVTRIGGTERVQAFTAIGTAGEGAPYQVETASGFAPWRRDVAWDRAGDAPIRPLLGELSFVGGATNWGYKFRYGLFEIDAADAASIARRMRREVAA